jgi:acyl-CoA synthetase (AMP-forming)/AMP-acid ligase II
VRIIQGYGLTETTNFSAIMPTGLDEQSYVRLMEEAAIPPAGAEIFGNEIAVLDNAGEPVPAGTVGEVCVRGHSVMSRYEGNPAETAEAFRHGWFHTGDLGYQAPPPSPGQALLVLTGRNKNVAKVRGESVSLEEVERAMRRLPGVLDAACAIAPHPLDGEQVTAAVVTAGPVAEGALRGLLVEMLTPSAVPRRIVRLSAIPRTPTGKIVRRELSERLRGP